MNANFSVRCECKYDESLSGDTSRLGWQAGIADWATNGYSNHWWKARAGNAEKEDDENETG